MTVFPDLKPIEKIGEGGMSVVWKAFDLKRNKMVAVKVLKNELSHSAEDLAMFKREEQVLAKVRHPGIVEAYELMHVDDWWYYIMEFVDGYNFNDLLKRKEHLGEVDCLLICESVAVALDYAWNDHGIVHCDIKPENIMINTEGVIKLTDLGLCHTFKFLKNGVQRVPDHVLGTPAYISPEQVYGDLEPDCRVDIYSLAATLYHLATGEVLFPGLDNETMLRAHCTDSCQATDPRASRPDLSEGFCQLLESMLVKDRASRVNSWKDVYRMCREVESGTVFKPRTTPGPSSICLGRGIGMI